MERYALPDRLSGRASHGHTLLLRQGDMSPDAIEHLLYHESGLLGISGVSNDMRDLLASAEPLAREAVEYFGFRANRELER